MDNSFKICQLKEAKEQGVISFTLTKRMVDRDSEVIEPRGMRAKQFKKNPVFLWAHDMSSPPLGRVMPETLKITDDEVTGDVKFDLDDPFAAMIYNKYKNKFLNAGSIRFIPLAFDKEPVLPGQKGMTITKWELLEFSAVPIPANPGALSRKESEVDENEIKLLKAIEEFEQDDNFDHTPEGWVERVKTLKSNAGADQHEDQDKDQDQGEEFDWQKPFPNEHACRLRDPADFQPNSFRRVSRQTEGKRYSVIMGKLKGQSTMTEQSYRYPKDVWPEAQARKHCKSHNGISFEPARKDADQLLDQFQPGELIAVEEIDGQKVLRRVYTLDNIKLHPFFAGIDLTKWEDVAGRMVALIEGDHDLSEENKQIVYDYLCKLYAVFGKEAPELNGAKTLDSQEELVAQLLTEDAMAAIINEVVNNLMGEE